MTVSKNALNAWVDALHDLTRTPDEAAQFREARTRFAVLVAQEASQKASAGKVPAVYGVWLDRHKEPVYVGQTMDACRRLWDLPIGESHHLANTYPPEIWSRIVVVRWFEILVGEPARHALLTAELFEMGLDKAEHLRAIGLMLEHRLQRQIRPRFNVAKRKSRSGGWREIDHSTARSLGAASVESVEWLHARVIEVWCLLSNYAPILETGASHPFGGLVLPSRIWRTHFISDYVAQGI